MCSCGIICLSKQTRPEIRVDALRSRMAIAPGLPVLRKHKAVFENHLAGHAIRFRDQQLSMRTGYDRHSRASQQGLESRRVGNPPVGRIAIIEVLNEEHAWKSGVA